MCVHLIAYYMGKKSLKENACNILGQKTMITLQQGKTKYPCLYYGKTFLRLNTISDQ